LNAGASLHTKKEYIKGQYATPVNGGQEARLNGGGHSLYWIETHFLPAWESRREA
jgi:hypothetical protein